MEYSESEGTLLKSIRFEITILGDLSHALVYLEVNKGRPVRLYHGTIESSIEVVSSLIRKCCIDDENMRLKSFKAA